MDAQRAPRRRPVLIVLVILATLTLLAKPASAHDVGIAPYAYFVVATGDQYLYRCAVGDNELVDTGSGSLNYVSAGSISRSGAFCADYYSLNAGSISAGYLLIFWNQGNPTTCLSQSGSNSITVPSHSVGAPFYGGPCGSGTYSVTSLHNIYVLGTWRSAILSSGYHSF